MGENICICIEDSVRYFVLNIHFIDCPQITAKRHFKWKISIMHSTNTTFKFTESDITLVLAELATD